MDVKNSFKRFQVTLQGRVRYVQSWLKLPLGV